MVGGYLQIFCACSLSHLSYKAIVLSVYIGKPAIRDYFGSFAAGHLPPRVLASVILTFSVPFNACIKDASPQLRSTRLLGSKVES